MDIDDNDSILNNIENEFFQPQNIQQLNETIQQFGQQIEQFNNGNIKETNVNFENQEQLLQQYDDTIQRLSNIDVNKTPTQTPIQQTIIQESLSNNMEDVGESSQGFTNIPYIPNHVLESLVNVNRFILSVQYPMEILMNRDGTVINGRLYDLTYEACKICKKENGSLSCSMCDRKVCLRCVMKNTNPAICNRCKSAGKRKNYINDEFNEIINNLVCLNMNIVTDQISIDFNDLYNRNLTDLIEIVIKLEKDSENLNRDNSIIYFYIGKLFFERMDQYFEDDSYGDIRTKKILSSYRHAKDLAFGKDNISIDDIKEKMSTDDKKTSRFFILCLKIFIVYKDFTNPEMQIRNAHRIPFCKWLRDLNLDKFIEFSNKLNQKIFNVNEENEENEKGKNKRIRTQ